ncbi:UNVERIFIED_CONTAM: hypothetical protein Slati_0902800 [Sesamum latifolium]|uniref:Uncharacterized protein n=1 Tax=Sesamum latifolium TaxID=2727402 RepID=A0AAW2XTK4_9LAMI
MELLLVKFLRKNVNMFAWSASDFQGISLEVIEHSLNVDLHKIPVRQKGRNFGRERNLVIENEVNKLLEAGYVQEVQYTEWLANVVIVPKPGGKWRNVHRFHRP